MTKFNPTYRNKILTILNEQSSTNKISLSSPQKIAGSKKLAFSLPAGPDFTCPGATDACKNCYAQKGRHVFPNVQKAFVSNWSTFKHYASTNDSDGLGKLISSELPKQAPIFRIHESGDFADQFAIEVWTKVAKDNPDTNFWFYTRSFKLDFSGLLALPNVNGWASTDEYNIKEAGAFAVANKIKQAHGPWDKDKPLPTNSFVCPATNGKLALESACSKCKLCITKDRTNKNVVFIGH